MWNRQREAEMAREILADVDEPSSAPKRNPPAPPLPEEREPELLPAADVVE
jgi:hypothetical protein